jgi:hypothetical protein
MNVKLYLAVGVLGVGVIVGAYMLGRRDERVACAQARTLEIAQGVERRDAVAQKVARDAAVSPAADIRQWLRENYTIGD